MKELPVYTSGTHWADQPGVPSLRASCANMLVRVLAMTVAAVGRVERAIIGDRGTPYLHRPLMPPFRGPDADTIKNVFIDSYAILTPRG